MSQTIEHIVLFNVKPDVGSTEIATMINEINGLASLNLTVHLSAGKLLRSSPNFSHIIHCRFCSTDDLKVYYDHPEHLRVVAENIQPAINDVVAVDWISDGIGQSLKPGSAMRVRLFKLKEDLAETEKGKLVEVIKGIKSQAEQISVGENFTPEMAKGYSICTLAVFHDLEAIDSDAELHESKVKDFIESEIFVDYVIPSA